MTKNKKIYGHNFWLKTSNENIGHTAQSILGLSKNKDNTPNNSCGAGSCNCGGGCNGECAT